jgi:chorismate mutase
VRTLEKVRADIDALDKLLVHILETRFALAREAREIKQAAALCQPFHDPERENELASRAPEGPVRDCYAGVIRACREAAV